MGNGTLLLSELHSTLVHKSKWEKPSAKGMYILAHASIEFGKEGSLSKAEGRDELQLRKAAAAAGATSS
jgi:hypothetical protein